MPYTYILTQNEEEEQKWGNLKFQSVNRITRNSFGAHILYNTHKHTQLLTLWERRARNATTDE